MSQGRLNAIAWSEGHVPSAPPLPAPRRLFADARLQLSPARDRSRSTGASASFELDEDALSDGRIVVLQLDAVLPGAARSSATRTATRRSRRASSMPRSSSSDMHMSASGTCVPNEPNSARAEEGVRDARMWVRTEELPDLARGAAWPSPVEVGDWNVRLFFDGEEEDIELHESLKLGEIVATGELSTPFALSPRCAPPLLSLQGFPRRSTTRWRRSSARSRRRCGSWPDVPRPCLHARPTAHVDAVHPRPDDAGVSAPALDGRDAALRPLHRDGRDGGCVGGLPRDGGRGAAALPSTTTCRDASAN